MNIKNTLSSLFFVCALAFFSFAQNGSLDLTFDFDGRVTTSFGSLSDIGSASVIQPDGKIVVAGYSNNGNDDDFAVVRYNTNGNLDTTFGLGGIALTDIGSGNDLGLAVALQSDGKILVAGRTLSNGAAVAVVRYTVDGSLDNTFDNDGIVTKDIESCCVDAAKSIAIQADGKIIVAGYGGYGPSTYDFLLMRFNGNGSLDYTFENDGIVTTNFSVTTQDIISSIALQLDGKIVVAGYSGDGSGDKFVVARYNPDGSLDNTFDTDGKLITSIGNTGSDAYAVAIQSDGKIVVAGKSNNGTNDDFAVVRYNSNGSLDNTFNGTGIVTTPIGSSADVGYAVTIQPDGKILLAGTSGSSFSEDFAVVRYNMDGSLDNTFDIDGKLTTPIGTSGDIGHSITLQIDNKIIVAGQSNSSINSGNDIAVARYNINGSLDSTFDADGKLTSPLGSKDAFGNALAIQNDGKTLVAGYSSNGANNDFTVTRYNTDGSLDYFFNSSGKAITPVGSSDDIANAIALQADGKIVVAGTSQNGSDDVFALARYRINGILDTAFDTDGIVTTSILNSHAKAYALAIQSDGKIVAAGYSYNGEDNDFTVIRYNTNGSLDNTFSANGIATTDMGFTDDIAYALALQSDGKILLAGYSGNGSSLDTDFAMIRYNTDGSLDNTFGAGGFVITPIGSLDEICYSVKIQSDGKIVLAGYSSNGADKDMAVARYKTNGQLDSTFNSTGITTTSIGNLEDVGYSAVIQDDGKILVTGYSKSANGNEFALVRFNPNGSLDYTFDNVGIVTTSVGLLGGVSRGIVLQNDGRIVLAGNRNNGTNSDFALARYNNTVVSGIESFGNESGYFSLYPNPVRDFVFVKTNSQSPGSDYFVKDADGRTVLSGKLTSDNTKINLRKLSAGLYFVIINNASQKIIKQ